MNLAATVLAALAGIALGVAPALAQGGPSAQRGPQAPPAPQGQAIALKCPKAGLLIETATDGQVTERTSRGPDPSDDTLCITALGSRTFRSYFSRFNPNLAPEGLTALRQGMAALFAGTSREFTAEFKSPTVNGGTAEYEATWRRLGAETVTVAGKPRDAIVFENTIRGIRGNTSHSHYRYWYAPAIGVWLKVQTVSGGATGRSFRGDWEVVKLVEP